MNDSDFYFSRILLLGSSMDMVKSRSQKTADTGEKMNDHLTVEDVVSLVDESIDMVKQYLLRRFPQEQIKEEIKNDMISVVRNNVPEEGSTPRGVQFLGPKHITHAGGHIAKITKVTTDKKDNFGNPYVVYFTMDGQRYSKGFKPTSPMLISLVDMFGEDEGKWINKQVLLNKKSDDEGERLTITPAPTPAGKGDGRIR